MEHDNLPVTELSVHRDRRTERQKVQRTLGLGGTSLRGLGLDDLGDDSVHMALSGGEGAATQAPDAAAVAAAVAALRHAEFTTWSAPVVGLPEGRNGGPDDHTPPDAPIAPVVHLAQHTPKR